MECDVCEEEASTECYECGMEYCEDCAMEKDGVCCIKSIRKFSNQQNTNGHGGEE